MSKTEKKWVHPECLEGEVFFGNFTECDFYNTIPVEFKRLGKLAYDENGKLLKESEQSDIFPVFFSKEDYDSLMQEVGQNMAVLELQKYLE